MRIDSCSLVNFGPVAASTWSPGDARLSVMTGPNGAGKSTRLVDAPLFALFGDVPDGSSPDQLVRIGATDMSVTLEFDLDGQAYRFIRRRTLRAGGKSSADAQSRNPDGTWTPIASGPTAVTAEACRLLRMDQQTFRTAVVLAQGDAQRFMDATPGKGTDQKPGRAAILSTLVVDPVFARAEARGREKTREFEAATSADRGQAARLADAIAELEPVRSVRDEAVTKVEEQAGRATELTAERETVLERLTVLAGELAAAAASREAMTRLEAERDDLADRYRRERASVAAAELAIAEASTTLQQADDVAKALEDLPTMRLEVAALETTERTDAELATQVRAKLDAIAALERPYDVDHASWSVRWKDAKRKVAEAEEHGRAGTSVCAACGQPIGRDVALQQLAQARAALKEIEAAEPKRPLSIDREKAALEQLRRRQLELDWQPDVLLEARRQLAELERAAARADSIAAARTSIERATAAKTTATDELGKISAAGQVVAERLKEAKAAVAGIAPLEAEQAQCQADAAGLASEIALADAARRAAERVLANAEAQLARLEQLTTERKALQAKLAAADVTLGRLRKLVAAFGVKGIPARVVEGVLPELVTNANELLGQLRPGMTVDLRATRAKADGSGTIEALNIWIRDWRGERQRWSGGEGTSISMSIAVGLSRLAARRSGARIVTLVIDEPDGLDLDSRRAFGEALRVLAHRGDLERVAVITHQDGIPDFADDVVELEPAIEPLGSPVEQVA